MENEVAIAILYYKDPQSLLPTLSALSKIKTKSHVWIINNGCKEKIKWPKDFEGFTHLYLDKNYGYAGGYNRALKSIFQHKEISAVMLLNPDAIIDVDNLHRFIIGFNDLKAKNLKLGLAQPLVLLPDGSINTSGNEMNYCGFSWTGRTEPKNRLDPFEIDFVSGCATMLSRKIFEASDGFDEDYFAYYEDTELSLRLSLQDYQHFLIPSSTITHHHDHSRNRKMWYFYERNRWKLILTYFPSPILFILLPALIYTEFLSIFMSIFRLDIGSKISSYVDNLKDIKNIYIKRRLKQKNYSSKNFFRYLQNHTKAEIEIQIKKQYHFLNKIANIPLIFWFKIICMMIK